MTYTTLPRKTQPPLEPFLLALLLAVLATFPNLHAAEFDAIQLEKIAAHELIDTNTPGAAIGIVRDGRLVWSKGLGVANVETGQPVTPETLFRLGSTTKMFTAAALVSLAEEGKLKLDEPVGKCISGLHPKIAALTPHQLLTHSAGLTDESVMSGRHDDAALGLGIRAMDESWFFTEPGQIHSYSNPGYWIAGLACEELAGQPYADLMAERLFRPLGMTRTTLRPTLAMTWPLALGHEVKSGMPSIVRPQADNAGTWPAGQMYSSVTDLVRFTTALHDGGRLDGQSILSQSLIKKLASPFVPRPGDDSHYGYGLAVSTERGVRIWQHGGSRTGYGSTIRLAPDQKIALIILTNRSASSLPKTAAAALDMLLPFEPLKETPKTAAEPLTEQEKTQLVGTYTNNRQTIELTIRDGKLMARPSVRETEGPSRVVTRTSQNRISLTASSDNGDSPRTLATFFIVPDPTTGHPAYLMNGSRALKRQSSPLSP